MNPPVSLDDARARMQDENWLGRDGLWVSLPPDGVVTWGTATWPSKLWTYALVPGRAAGAARRVDGPTPAGVRVEFNGDAGGEGPGFIPSGYLFPSDGCWEATYRVGDHSLVFVVNVLRR